MQIYLRITSLEMVQLSVFFFWLQEAPNDALSYPQLVKTIETVSTSIVSPSDTIVLNFYIYQTNNDCWMFSNTIHYIYFHAVTKAIDLIWINS